MISHVEIYQRVYIDCVICIWYKTHSLDFLYTPAQQALQICIENDQWEGKNRSAERLDSGMDI